MGGEASVEAVRDVFTCACVFVGQLFESQFGVTWPPWVLATPHVKIEIEQKIEIRALLMRKAASTQAVPWPHV